MKHWLLLLSVLLSVLTATPVAAQFAQPTSSNVTLTVSAAAVAVTANTCKAGNTDGAYVFVVTNGIYASFDGGVTTPSSSTAIFDAKTSFYFKPISKLRMVRQASDATVFIQCAEGPDGLQIARSSGGGGGVTSLTANNCATLGKFIYLSATTTIDCAPLNRVDADTVSFDAATANTRPMFGLYPAGTPAGYTSELSLHEKVRGATSERMFDVLMDATAGYLAVHRTDDLLAYLPIRIGTINAAGAFTEAWKFDLPNNLLVSTTADAQARSVGAGVAPTGVAGDIKGSQLILTPNTNQIALGTTNIGTISMAALTLGRTWTFPNVTGNVVTTGDSATVTNAMLAGSIDLTTKVAGVLPVANGGTNASAVPATNALMKFDGVRYVAGIGRDDGTTISWTGRRNTTADANAVTIEILKRFTDTAPTGNYLDFQNALGASVFTVNITGQVGVATKPLDLSIGSQVVHPNGTLAAPGIASADGTKGFYFAGNRVGVLTGNGNDFNFESGEAHMRSAELFGWSPGADPGAALDAILQRKAADTVGTRLGASTATHALLGIADIQTSAAGIGNGADATDDTLFTFSLPLNSLSANGKSVRVRAWGKTAANANSKTIKLWFAGTTAVSSGAIAINNIDWMVTMEVTRLTATTVSIVAFYENGAFANGATTVTANLTVADLSLNASIIKVTGASAASAASDVLAMGMKTWFEN